MNILVTGATGLVGSAIIKELLLSNHHISALYREGSDRSQLPFDMSRVEWREGDLLDVVALKEAVKGIDYVFHSAATVSFVPKYQQQMYNINVTGTANLVNACLESKVSKFCHVSSVAALGQADSKKIVPGQPVNIDEKNHWEDSSENSNYGKTKYLAELEVWRGIAEGLNAVIVNPSVILGEGDWTRSSTQLFRYVYNQNLFYTPGFLNYVDVRDVASICCQLIFSEVQAERYILNGGRISYKEFFDKIAETMNRKTPAIKVGRALASVIWRLEALRSLLTGSDPLITKETARSAYKNVFFRSEKIQQTLNYSFTPLDTSLTRICKSFEKYN